MKTRVKELCDLSLQRFAARSVQYTEKFQRHRSVSTTKLVNVSLSGATVKYRSGRVIGPLTTSFRQGTTLLLGPNGTGKSTILKMLAGLLKVQSGEVRVPQDSLGYLNQTVRTLPNMTVGQQVAYSAWLKKLPTHEIEPRVDQSLRQVNLLDERHSKASRLSGGQQRRLGIAEQLVDQPSTLLMDEPLAGLDPLQIIDVRRILERFPPEQTTIVSSHHIDDVVSIANRVLCLRRGSIIFDGDRNEFLGLSEGSLTSDRDRAESAYERLYRN